MGRVWIISGIGLLISGCTLSAGTQLTSYAIQAVQAVTLAVTEKSVMDHGISAIAQQDCVLRRILASEPICKDIDDLDGALAIAAANGDMDATSGVAVVDAAGVAEAANQVITIQTSALQDVAAPLPVSLKSKPGEKAGDLYFIIGSFNTDSRAKRFVSQYPSLSPKVVRAEAKGRRVYRVAVGPFARDDADLQR
ncbi:MAG: SPOR domain-containing protein, partial [Rhodospirillales bacterium]